MQVLKEIISLAKIDDYYEVIFLYKPDYDTPKFGVFSTIKDLSYLLKDPNKVFELNFIHIEDFGPVVKKYSTNQQSRTLTNGYGDVAITDDDSYLYTKNVLVEDDNTIKMNIGHARAPEIMTEKVADIKPLIILNGIQSALRLYKVNEHIELLYHNRH